uniref:Putative snare protein tlg2/syntaxin 16 n=2 Tax=Anopheles marajoara TaxID=58244 RepID=A0A2M4BTK2_9DIPT
MSHRNLTELFHMLRNNAVHNRNVGYENHSDNETLLDDPGKANDQPRWIGKYDEANYLLFKIQERVDEIKRLKSAEVRSVLSDDSGHNRTTVESCLADVKSLIFTCHENVNSLAMSASDSEKTLLRNIQKHFLFMLQGLTEQLRQLQANKQLQRSLATSESNHQLTEINLIGPQKQSPTPNHTLRSRNSVDTFDNFLELHTGDGPDGDSQQLLDDYFQLPATGLTINQKQIMLLQADNTKMLKSREDEVIRMTHSITDLNVIFKDISQLIQEQGTVLDRIDYNIESAQVHVSDGLRQLKKTESYQRKNRKLHCITLLALMIMFMIVLIIFTKL